MLLNKIELTRLVVRAFNRQKLTERETKVMLRALWKKYWSPGLDSFQERMVLASYIVSPDSKKERDGYIKRAVDRIRSRTTPSR